MNGASSTFEKASSKAKRKKKKKKQEEKKSTIVAYLVNFFFSPYFSLALFLQWKKSLSSYIHKVNSKSVLPERTHAHQETNQKKKDQKINNFLFFPLQFYLFIYLFILWNKWFPGRRTKSRSLHIIWKPTSLFSSSCFFFFSSLFISSCSSC